MNTVFIAIGSNLNEPITQTKDAIEALKNLPETNFSQASSLYRSTPMGPKEQPDYVNAVVSIRTNLSPLALLNATQAIELEHGRIRKKERWGPRTLDLDILLYGNEIIHNERLIVPHYGMREREFVLYPLSEIAPNLKLPDGTELSSLLRHVDKNSLSIWQE